MLNVKSKFAKYLKLLNNKRKKNLNLTAKFFSKIGGDDRDRTDYLLNAIQALSQVSYTPTRMVIHRRFELRTP